MEAQCAHDNNNSTGIEDRTWDAREEGSNQPHGGRGRSHVAHIAGFTLTLPTIRGLLAALNLGGTRVKCHGHELSMRYKL